MRNHFGLEPALLSAPVIADAALGNWCANLVTIDRRKTLIFMSERTLLSFLLFGVRKQGQASLAELFLNGLGQLLEMEGFEDSQIHRAFGSDGLMQYSKATNGKALGNLNELQQIYEHRILSEGGFSGCDLWGIMRSTNRMPQRNLGWAYSIDVAREVLGA